MSARLLTALANTNRSDLGFQLLNGQSVLIHLITSSMLVFATVLTR